MYTRRFRGKRLPIAIAMIVGLTIVGAGCGSSSDDGDTTGEEPANAAFLSYDVTDFVQAEIAGMESVIEPTGGSLEVSNAKFDPQAQLKQCQDAVTSGRFNAIILAPVDGAAVAPCVQQAADADIPVVAAENPVGPDRDAIEPQLDGVVGSVVYTGAVNGRQVSQLTIDACKGIDPCNVILELAFRADPFSAVTLEDLQATIDESPNINLAQVTEGGYDPALTAERIPDVLAANPDVDVILFEADSNAVAALPAINDAGLDDVKVIGNGGSRQGVMEIENGNLFASTGTWPFQAGEIIGQMAVDTVNGTAIEEPAVDYYAIDSPELITADNVSEFKPEWPLD